MRYTIGAHLECDVITSVDVVLALTAATGPRVVEESLVAAIGAAPVALTEVIDDHGTRLHLADAIAPGCLTVDYSASLESSAPPADVDPADVVRYRRPSRYCESDRLGPFARAEFAGIEGHDLLSAVSSWVGTRLEYVSGSSRPTDGAVATLLARKGVCRDFAHLVVAFLRACDVPARFASVYAPGLEPMDFHAVAEAYVDHGWHVVDATCMAPRSSMVRIATGRDAADTAFLSTSGGIIDFRTIEVTAYTDGDLPSDDLTALATLGPTGACRISP